MTTRDAKHFACLLIASHTYYHRPRAGAWVGGSDEDRVNAAIDEIIEEMMRRAGVDEFGPHLTPEMCGITNYTPPESS